MKRGLSFLFTIFFASSVATFAASPSLVRVSGLSKADRDAIITSGADIAKVAKTSLDIVCPEGDATPYSQKGYATKVLIPDLDAYIAKIMKTSKVGEAYYTFETMTAQMKKWAEEYPTITTLESLGVSHENREIWALKLSDNPSKNEKEPAVLVMGAHHAREWPSFEVPMATLKLLLEGYGKDENLTRLVNEREIWFVPMVNPDGVAYSMTGSRYWRKNRRNNGGGKFGVDLNRNYGYKWGNVGASNSPSSDTYHGTGAFSEPECQAVKLLVEREKFQASVSFHTYSELILYPFGYGYNIPNPDLTTFKKLAGEMATFNRYEPQNSADLYPAMGDTDDWLYGEHKALAFTFELCSTFIPSPSQIPDFNNRNVPAIIHLIDKAGSYALTTPSGDEELIKSLDLADSLGAVAHATSLLAENPDQADVANRLEAAEKHLAEMVATDLLQGNLTSWEQTAGKSFSHTRVLARDQVLFAQAHGKEVRADVLALVKN